MISFQCEARGMAHWVAATIWLACVASGCATFSVDSQPPGDCYFNGQFVGKTPYSGVYTAAQLQGSRCSVVLPGHDVAETMQLPPAPNVIPMESAPQGAQVWAA